MKRWALIKNKYVDLITEQENRPIIDGEWVDVTGLHVGPRYIYNGTEFLPPPPEPNIVTKVAFRFRLTDEEYVNIFSASKTDIEVAAWMETFNMVSQIDLNNQRTINGINILVAKNLLTEQRAQEILNAPVQIEERP